MTKDVIVSIAGLQGEAGGDEPVEIITRADYYLRNGKHYVSYEEFSEDTAKVSNVLLKICEDRVEMTKKGEVNVYMQFEAGKMNTTMYDTPFGKIPIAFHTSKVELGETEEQILVHIQYDLDINYVHTSECDLTIRVTPKEHRHIFMEP